MHGVCLELECMPLRPPSPTVVGRLGEKSLVDHALIVETGHEVGWQWQECLTKNVLVMMQVIISQGLVNYLRYFDFVQTITSVV